MAIVPQIRRQTVISSSNERRHSKVRLDLPIIICHPISAMSTRTNLPDEPTRPMRRNAIRNSVDRLKSILRSVGRPDLTPTEIAEEAHLRVERAKTGPAVEYASGSAKRRDRA